MCVCIQATRLDTAQEDLTASRVSLRSLQKELSSMLQENAMLREAADSAASKEHVTSTRILAMQEGTVFSKRVGRVFGKRPLSSDFVW